MCVGGNIKQKKRRKQREDQKGLNDLFFVAIRCGDVPGLAKKGVCRCPPQALT